jgi:hypothetical protein
VVKNADDKRAFDRPHEAWRYFQQLTNAPDRDVRPEPPPINPVALSTGPKPRNRRPQRLPTNS